MCHRAGAQQIRKDRVAGGSSGKKRDRGNQSTKKCGCLASLVIVCYADDLFNAHVEYRNTHNHTLTEDTWCLPRSDELNNEIEQEVKKNYSTREIVMALERKYKDLPAHRREANVHAREVINARQKHLRNTTRLDANDFVSARKWLERLHVERQFAVWGDNEFDLSPRSHLSKYSFGFMSPSQYTELMKAKAWGIDATHDIGPYANGVLYTVIVRADTGNGVPVAYLFTNDLSAKPLIEWFYELRDREAAPTKITIDASLPEDNALQAVFGDHVSIQYCTWHVRRAWTSQLQARVKTASVDEAANASDGDDDDDDQQQQQQQSDDDFSDDGSNSDDDSDEETAVMVEKVPEDVKHTRSCMNNDLEELMYGRDVDAFHQKLHEFEEKWSSSQPSFWGYFNRYWISNEKYKRWAKCYQPAMYTNMETNNYVESWHRVLKHTYLRSKRNQRLDLLIHILVDRVEPDMVRKARVYKNRVGPMSPEEAFARSLERKAKAFLEKGVVQNPVEKLSDDTFLVRSFVQNSSEKYTVIIKYLGLDGAKLIWLTYIIIF